MMYTNSKFLLALLQFAAATTLLHWRAVAATADPDSALSDPANGDRENGYEEAKRSNWQSLQGPWGKRNLLDGTGGGDNGLDELSASGHSSGWIIPVLIATDGRQPPQVVAYGGAGYNSNYNNGLRSSLGDTDLVPSAEYRFLSESPAEEDDDNDLILNEKRTWKNMNVAWGKRRNAQAWNKFRGSWGKREPGWNNLKGMWGKRSSNWQKLHGGWGKRSDAFESGN